MSSGGDVILCALLFILSVVWPLSSAQGNCGDVGSQGTPSCIIICYYMDSVKWLPTAMSLMRIISPSFFYIIGSNI